MHIIKPELRGAQQGLRTGSEQNAGTQREHVRRAMKARRWTLREKTHSGSELLSNSKGATRRRAARCKMNRRGPHHDLGPRRVLAAPDEAPTVGSSLDDRCEGGDPDLELCTLDEEEERKVASASTSATETADVLDEVWTRGRWLLGLLVLQSSSSFVLDHYQELLREHIVVTLFLTMLVGAGGNAGNQSAIKVIRGLATRKMDGSLESALSVLYQQVLVGLCLGLALASVGYVRVYLTNGSHENASAISLALFFIVLSSTILGTSLPFVLNEFGIDPANAGTSIQVIMDILGVTITCITCNFVLNQLAASTL